MGDPIKQNLRIETNPTTGSATPEKETKKPKFDLHQPYLKSIVDLSWAPSFQLELYSECQSFFPIRAAAHGLIYLQP